MLSALKDRFEYVALKNHLENSFDEQYWAKDTVAKAFSLKFKGQFSNLIAIGPKGEWFYQRDVMTHVSICLFISKIYLFNFQSNFATCQKDVARKE